MKHKLLRFSSIVAALVFVTVFFGLAVYNTPGTTAVKATDFQAGRIIDDEIFYNKDTMTVAEIQTFLNNKSVACDTWGEKPLGSARVHSWGTAPATMKRADYAKWRREVGGDTKYHDPPYVCVSQYYENPTTHETNFTTNLEVKEGMISAAEIIYRAAQQYNINPQVLLVMLKKESYVWGDDWPLKHEYNTVMGYGCPDTAPCDQQYFGFYNQIMKAAWQLNYYKDHIYSYGYFPFTTNNIYYSPTASCGYKSVYLENIATTSLYIYTPYTPNEAALKNYPGTATCGSYGNRNFFMYFNEWFGTTLLSNVSRVAAMDVPTTSVNILTKDEAMSMQLTSLSKDNSIKLTMGAPQNGDLDTFTISKYSDGTYKVQINYSELVVDIPSNSVISGKNVQQYISNNTDAQKWLIYVHEDETYSIVSKTNNNYALSYHENGLMLERYVGAEYQKFKFKAADENTTEPEPSGGETPTTEETTGILENGSYIISSSLKANYLFDAADVNKKDGIGIVMHDKSKAVATTFELTYQNDTDSYAILNTKNERYVTITSTNTLVLNSKANDCSQSWKISQNEDESYTLESLCREKVIDVKSAGTTNGTTVWTYDKNGTKAQQWQIEKYVEETPADPPVVTPPTNSQLIANGTYELKSKVNTKYALDVSGNSKQDGTNVQIWESNGTMAQQWVFTYNATGDYYTIIGKNSGKALDVSGASIKDKANVQIYTSNNTCAQHWKAVKNSDGSYTFLSACSQKALDINCGLGANGINVQQYTSNNTAAQKWVLVKK